MAWIEEASYKAADFELSVKRWDFPDSGISCVFGESGSGKTTFLQIMAGLLPNKSKLCVKGEILSDLPIKVRNIGFVFQDYALFPHMTVLENLAFAAQAKGLSRHIWSEHGARLLEKLDIKSISAQKTGTLSGGEQQRVALARALVTKPKLVLMDEPLSALDENRKDEARELLLQLADEFSVPFILVTHDIRDVRLLSQNMIVLKKGKILGAGKTVELLDHPSSLELARTIPENQIIPTSPQFHSTRGQFAVAKSWSFQVSVPTEKSLLRGTIVKVFCVGPGLACHVRLSSGQLIKAVAPLGAIPKGEVGLEYSPSSLVFF